MVSAPQDFAGIQLPWLSVGVLVALWLLSLLVAYFAGRSDEQRKDDEA